MIGGGQSRGEIPGFDSTTGEAISLNGAQWRQLIRKLIVVSDNFTRTIRAYEGDVLRYEIMALESELR